MKQLSFVLSSALIVLSSLFINTYTVSAQTNCVKILNLQVQGTVEMGKQFQCVVTADQPQSPNVACGIRIGDLNQWPNNYCPSDTSFGGWNGNTATFNCTIPQRNDINSSTQAQLVAYDFSNACGPQTGKTLSITIGGQGGSTPGPTQPQGTGTTTPTTTQTTGGPTPTQGGGTNNSVDLNKCTGYDVDEIVRKFYEVTKNQQLADDIKNKLIAACSGKQTTNPNTSVTGTNPSITITGSIPSDIQNLINASEPPSQLLLKDVQGCLQNKSVYQQAAQATGLPWQLFAGIHFREGGCNPTHSMVSGRVIGNLEPDLHGACSSQDVGPGKPIPLPNGGCGFSSLLDSVIYGGNLLIRKINHLPANVQDITLALSRYNGGGNRNCGKTPYSYCPPPYPGDDDMYVNNKFDAKHIPMYLVYCADYTPCNPPKIYSGLGVLTVVKAVAYADQL